MMKELLKMIRFPVMGMQDFANEVSPTGIFSKDELLAMFFYFANPEYENPVYIIFYKFRWQFNTNTTMPI